MRLSKNDEIELMKNILKQNYGLDQFRKMLGTDTQKETKKQIIKDPDHAINIMQRRYWRRIEISVIWCFWFIYSLLKILTNPFASFSEFLILLTGVPGPILLGIYVNKLISVDNNTQNNVSKEAKPLESDSHAFNDILSVFCADDTILKLVLDKDELADWQLKMKFCQALWRKKEVAQLFTDNPQFLTLVKTLDKAAGKKEMHTYAYLNRPNRVETTYEVDVTKLPQYPKTKQAIKQDLAVLGQKLEDQVLQPDLTQIVDYIMQSGNPDLVSYLPITVHENYSNTLLENAMDE